MKRTIAAQRAAAAGDSQAEMSSKGICLIFWHFCSPCRVASLWLDQWYPRNLNNCIYALLQKSFATLLDEKQYFKQKIPAPGLI